MVHRIHNRNTGYLNPAINPNANKVENNNNSLSSTPVYGANALKIDQDLEREKENVSSEQNDTGIKDDSLNEIPLDNLGYIENTEKNNNEEHSQKQGEEDATTPQLFSEDIDSFKKELGTEKESDSLISDNEEEDYEIPAFLRKQKN